MLARSAQTDMLGQGNQNGGRDDTRKRKRWEGALFFAELKIAHKFKTSSDCADLAEEGREQREKLTQTRNGFFS